MIGADINIDVVGVDAHQYVKNALKNGLIINATSEKTIRIAPPLTFKEEHIFKTVEILKKSVAS